MSKKIEMVVKREITHIQQLCDVIMYYPKLEGLEILDNKTRRDLCDRIIVACTRDAGDIRSDANFAVNKLSEALERMTKMMEEKEKIIRDLYCQEPRRNCDRFGGDRKRLQAEWWEWSGKRENCNDDGTVKLTYGEWLLASVNESEGANG